MLKNKQKEAKSVDTAPPRQVTDIGMEGPCEHLVQGIDSWVWWSHSCPQSCGPMGTDSTPARR